MTDGSLVEAAKSGEAEYVRRLLDSGASVEEKNTSGDTALIWAAWSGYLNVVRLLLDRGAAIEQKGGGGYTPLGIAAIGGRLDVVRLLLDRGALLAGTSNAGETALDLAIKNSKTDVAYFLTAEMQKPKETAEDWVKMGASSIAFVGIYPRLQKKLTHIFNFETRERLVILQNLETKADVMAPPTGFDDLPSPAIEKALGEFERQGGAADRAFVLQGASDIGKPKRLKA